MLSSFLAQCETRGFTPDEAQLSAARRLQKLHEELVAFKHKRRTRLRKLFINPALPRGVYFWGGVGRGKSLLMDSFFASLPYKRKRRVHFHAFMREVHEQLKKHKQQQDPLMGVADDIAETTRVLCFDEFHVSDIADAMILGRLYGALSERGVVFCMTSNYPPDGLYPNGLQRQNFLPTIKLLKQRLDVVEVDAGIDYRRRALERIETYLVPADAAALRKMEQDFEALSSGEGHARPIPIQERDLPVIRRAPAAIWFDFATLCGGPRSQNDYLELARRFQNVLLSDVPRMTRDMASEARRFTWLVDVFYDHRVKLILSAACPAEDLYLEGPQSGEFHRTVSRLNEMRSREYLSEPHRLDQ
ncbi:MAG: cell division protein ZapE [Rhodocyclaceae bacterium]|nr:cell division protein ZapE [Rhodocyclaceae bacterium]